MCAPYFWSIDLCAYSGIGLASRVELGDREDRQPRPSRARVATYMYCLLYFSKLRMMTHRIQYGYSKALVLQRLVPE